MLREDINILSEALNGATDLISMISTKIDPTTRLDFLNALAMDGRLNAGAVRIGIILLSHRNGKTGLICPSHRTVAREAGCAVSTVQRSIRTLVTAGWFRVIHQAKDGKKTVNRYVPDWDRIDRSPMTTLDKSSMIDRPVIHDLPDQSPMTGETGHQRPIEP
jgi:predicted transcriptional regulator